ncbi:MAG: cupredoxin domain-containing protein [Nitrosopumilaceae archaeon]
MVNQYIWVAIAVGVFFVGIGVSYAIFANTYDPVSMKFQNQQLFDQMMTNNPKMSAEWMQTMVQDPQHMQQMQTMMQDPQLRQQMMDMMMQNPEMMQAMMQNQQMMGMMGQGHMGGMMMGPGMMQGSQSFESTQSLPSEIEPQTRTFEIFMDEVEFFAEVESEGDEEIAFVELHQWNPNIIVVNKGDTVVLEVSNPRKHAHTLTIPDFGVSTDILESRTGSESIQFLADKSGVFTFYCGLPYNPDIGYCDPDHSMMTGTLIVLE